MELKTWVAKEATDNGQVVDDSMLTDQAIFDRLDHDIEFRSVATRLVQRYGYLLPAVNPDSALGKQQELVLKERAHIMAQRQDQEQARMLADAESERRSRSSNRELNGPLATREIKVLRRTQSWREEGNGGSFQDDITIPDLTTPIMPDQTSPASSQRGVRRSSADQSDSGGSQVWDSGSDAWLRTTRRSPGGMQRSQAAGPLDMGMGGSRPGGATAGYGCRRHASAR